MVVRLCPLAKPLFDSLPKRIDALLNEGKERVHGLPFNQELEARILPYNELIDYNPNADVLFGHDRQYGC